MIDRSNRVERLAFCQQHTHRQAADCISSASAVCCAVLCCAVLRCRMVKIKCHSSSSGSTWHPWYLYRPALRCTYSCYRVGCSVLHLAEQACVRVHFEEGFALRGEYAATLQMDRWKERLQQERYLWKGCSPFISCARAASPAEGASY
jgi:hypothetical protein